MHHQSAPDLKERVELIQSSHFLIFLKLTAKQASTCRTMLGCVILCHRLMMHDQPPLGLKCLWVSHLTV